MKPIMSDMTEQLIQVMIMSNIAIERAKGLLFIYSTCAEYYKVMRNTQAHKRSATTQIERFFTGQVFIYLSVKQNIRKNEIVLWEARNLLVDDALKKS